MYVNYSGISRLEETQKIINLSVTKVDFIVYLLEMIYYIYFCYKSNQHRTYFLAVHECQ